MTPADKKRAARRIVTARLRLFYDEVKRYLGDTNEVWRRAEKKATCEGKPHPW
jgi:hypothetical protein